MRRLGLAVPMALCVIVGVLFMTFGRWAPTLLILMLLPVAARGAVASLRLMQVKCSVSSAVGCIALLGQVVLSGVIECMQHLRARRDPQPTAGARARGTGGVPACYADDLLAMLELVPAALAHGMGSAASRDA
mgnify:CR=1 FL=1